MAADLLSPAFSLAHVSLARDRASRVHNTLSSVGDACADAAARGDSTRLDSARHRRLRLRLLGSPRLSPSPPRCMYAFYAACTALDAFLSRAAINRRNIEVEAPASTVRARLRETSRPVRQPISAAARTRYQSSKERERERDNPEREPAEREQRKKESERIERERERRKQRVEEEETRSRGDKDREIDDFSDALPRTKKSPLLSLGRVGKSAIPENRFRGSRAGTSHRKTRPRSSARLDTLLRKPGSWLHGVCVRLRELSYHTGRCACTLGIRTYTHVRVIGIARTPGETLPSWRYWWGYDPRLVRKLNGIFWKTFEVTNVVGEIDSFRENL